MKMGDSAAHTHAALSGIPIDPRAGFAYEGKVMAINPADSTVDIRLFNGQPLRRVRVLFNSANTVAGFRYLASVQNNAPQNTPSGVIDDGVLTHLADTIATIIYVQGDTLSPRVIGFSFPLDAQMHINEQGLAMFRHESGVYSLIDKTGHHETHYPDGSYIIAAPDTSPKPIGSEGQPWNPPTGAPNINITIHLAQGFDISIKNGVLSLAGGTKGVARVGDSVQVNVGGTIYTGTITGGSSKVISG
ncbi:hypothetical protein SD70_02555 [Gordoniibacillus kamchatkensis]|uniref:Phage protein Gp138 N-terminal domain-containing protein n=1 Tax=Gordoniibacillus kamchatkensis TaxID=1590651 RepID=A0ABR5AM71_9BACL|nr:hypothetical protein [Paenibacillus sp. VKM B-2647]KIL42084.1 hypothetical protein SD70_02555 [Paenibacillus sp. VKM B-2647]